MPRDPRLYLWDVRDAAEAIASFVAGMDASSYAASELVRSAVERKFEVIGEALNQLAKADAALAERIPQLPEIVAFRNVLIHGYAVVDHQTVWGIVQESLPPLRLTVDTLLLEASGPDGS